MKFKQPIQQGIDIQPTCNDGFVVRVGCSMRAYPNTDEGRNAMLNDLDEYIQNDKAVRKEYNHHGENRPELVEDVAPPLQARPADGAQQSMQQEMDDQPDGADND